MYYVCIVLDRSLLGDYDMNERIFCYECHRESYELSDRSRCVKCEYRDALNYYKSYHKLRDLLSRIKSKTNTRCSINTVIELLKDFKGDC